MSNYGCGSVCEKSSWFLGLEGERAKMAVKTGKMAVKMEVCLHLTAGLRIQWFKAVRVQVPPRPPFLFSETGFAGFAFRDSDPH